MAGNLRPSTGCGGIAKSEGGDARGVRWAPTPTANRSRQRLARYHRLTKDPEVLRAITVGIDQMIRECWQEDKKVLRYTACPDIDDAPMDLFLAAEAIAYEVTLTGNRKPRGAMPHLEGSKAG